MKTDQEHEKKREQFDIVCETLAKSQKKNVTYVGWQEQVNEPPFLLVNDANHSTIAYNPDKHILHKSNR